jgi:uncharacterized protein DUF2868
MNERGARDAVLVRAIETADRARETWTDDDRAWALRAAGEIVGERAPADAFIARRAALVLERLHARFPRIGALSAVPSPRGWIAVAAAVGAFIAGVAGAGVGAAQTINLLAPPALALFAWNVGVYVVLLLHRVRPRRTGREPGPIRRAMVRWLRDVSRASRTHLPPAPLAAALRRFAVEWPALAMPLWQQRAARLLHVGAACLALGMIAGLYLRGIALEFRANWQSTFLDAADVARILRVVLAPGEWLTGIRVPGAAHLGTLGGASAGENAAPWIHLYAATILLVVIVPRLVLAGIAWMRERRLSLRFPIALDGPYFERLVRAWREGRVGVLVVPYSYDVPEASRSGLARLLARVHDGGVDVQWTVRVAYGDDALPPLDVPPHAGIVALFNLSATPERENQGSFVAALRDAAAGVPLVAIVDTSSFVERFGNDAPRLAERERAWRAVLDAGGIDPLFVRLADPDVAHADVELADRLERVT